MTTRPKLTTLPPAPSGARRDHAGTRAGGEAKNRSDAIPATLCLAIGRTGVGLELASPATIGCLRVTALGANFRDVRFPIDVSGGVARFRHRRGELQRLEFEVPARALERWVAPRLRGIVSTRSPDVWVAVGHACVTVCVSAEAEQERYGGALGGTAEGVPEPSAACAPALAFDVHVVFEGDDAVLVVHRARGANLGGTAQAMAIACVEAALGPRAQRNGSIFTLRRVASAFALTLFPDAGARIPTTAGVAWSVLGREGDTWFCHAARGGIPSPPAEEAVKARAIAILLSVGDDALVDGDFDRARAAFLDALERAPGHGEIVRRIVEIDARVPGREEALLTLVGETVGTPPDAGFTGPLRAELHAAMGDMASAVASLERAAEAEVAPALSSRVFERAAFLSRDPEDAARWLDHAVARSPRAIGARWARVRTRLLLGRVEEAVADVAHLEALARGTRAKHAVWVRAGRAFQVAGLRARARSIFERALRYAPEDVQALAGLGEALVSEGGAARGVSILSRALGLARDRGEPTGALLLLLGRAFAESLDDLPTAIAQVAAIPVEAVEAPMARGLEGRWRARLGDVVGAGLAFARMREIAASLAVGGDRATPALPSATLASGTDERISTLVEMLREAADLETERRRDLLAAQRHLAVALRLRPHHPEVRRAYREIGAAIVANEGTPPHAPGSPWQPSAPTNAESTEPVAEAPLSEPRGEADAEEKAGPPIVFDSFADAGEDAILAARADELGRRVQADPRDEAAVDELASVLEALGRGHELLALMMGRLEDAVPEKRMELVVRVRAVLERLALAAEVAGRKDEAALFRGMQVD